MVTIGAVMTSSTGWSGIARQATRRTTSCSVRIPAGLPWESVTIATQLPACAMLFTASLTLAVRATSTGFGPM